MLTPDNDRTRLINRPRLEIGAFRNMVQEEFEQVVRLLTLEADDATRETLVYE